MNTYLRHRTAHFRRWLGRSHSAAGLRLVAWLEHRRHREAPPTPTSAPPS